MTAGDFDAILVTLKLALCSTTILMAVCVPIALWVSRRQGFRAQVATSLLSLPLVLPPTVLGFYLLVAFGPSSPLGRWLGSWAGLSLVFSFPGLLLGSVLYSLPFVLQPLIAGFAAVGGHLIEAAKVEGCTGPQVFWHIIMPLTRRPMAAAALLGFAHTLGEFGVVLMVGGSIPGETRVLSIAIYDYVEAFDYDSAHRLAGGLLVASFLVIFTLTRLAAGGGSAGGK